MAAPAGGAPSLLPFEDDDVGPAPSVDAASDDTESLYALLGLTRDATEDDVKRAYRSLAAACHPDKVADPDLRPAAAAAFARLQHAHEGCGREEKALG